MNDQKENEAPEAIGTPPPAEIVNPEGDKKKGKKKKDKKRKKGKKKK
jgi:hypothetical protein